MDNICFRKTKKIKHCDFYFDSRTIVVKKCFNITLSITVFVSLLVGLYLKS